MIRDFLTGTSYLVNGIKAFYRDKNAWKFALPPLLLTLVFYTILALGSFYLISMITMPEFLPEWLNETFRIVLYVLVVITSLILLPMLTLTTLYEICGGLFFDTLAEYWDKKYFDWHGHLSWKKLPVFFWDSIVLACKILLLFIILSFLGIFFPIIGQLLTVWIMGKYMSLALLCSVSFNHDLRMKNLELRCRHNLRVRSFGISAYLLSLIPGAIILILPGMIIGSVELFNAELTDDHLRSHAAERP